MVVPLLTFTLHKKHCLILGRRGCFSLDQFLYFVLVCFASVGVFPGPLQCWNIVLKQLCGLWLSLPSFSVFHHVETSCRASSKQIFLNPNKKWGPQHTTSFGCEIRVKVTCTHPVLAVVNLGLLRRWSFPLLWPELTSQQQMMSWTPLDGKLSCQSPSPFQLSKQAFSPSLKEFCWSKPPFFPVVWIADPSVSRLCWRLNTTVDALLKRERTMSLFHFSGICQEYFIALKCWDVISITEMLYFSISPLLGLKTKYQIWSLNALSNEIWYLMYF